MEALKDENGGCARRGVEALGEIGDPAVPALMEALKNKDGDMRRAAAGGRWGRSATQAFPALLEALRMRIGVCAM
jgi:HEAT repeat protein